MRLRRRGGRPLPPVWPQLRAHQSTERAPHQGLVNLWPPRLKHAAQSAAGGFWKNLTLDRVLQVCKAHESSTDTGHALSSQDPSAHLLAARQSSYKRQAHASRPQRTTTETSPCYYCGDGSHPRSQCPARRQFCQQCGKQGHFAVVCRQKARQSVQQATLGHLYLHQTEKAGDHLISILVTLHDDCQLEIRWLPDSGADVDALSAQDFNRLGPDLQNHLAPNCQLVRAANGGELGSLGTLSATLTLNGRSCHTTLHIYPQMSTSLLSKATCIQLGLLEVGWPQSRLAKAAA